MNKIIPSSEEGLVGMPSLVEEGVWSMDEEDALIVFTVVSIAVGAILTVLWSVDVEVRTGSTVAVDWPSAEKVVGVGVLLEGNDNASLSFTTQIASYKVDLC